MPRLQCPQVFLISNKIDLLLGVCKYWHTLIESSWVWRRLCFLRPWKLSPRDSEAQLERHRRLSGEDTISQSSNGSDHFSNFNSNIDWKQVFRERFKLRRSWLSGQCHVRTFEGHTGGISCVQFDGGRIVSGSHDKTIRVWNIKTNSPWSVMTLTGHSGEVRFS